MKQKRAHYGNALEYQNLQDRNPVEATEIQPYINKYGLQLLVHVGRRESYTQLQPIFVYVRLYFCRFYRIPVLQILIFKGISIVSPFFVSFVTI